MPMAIAARADLYRLGSAAPTERLEDCLARITAEDAAIGAFVAVDPAGARRDAAESCARWRADAPRSPIDGVIVGVKANIAVAGWPWHAGIDAYRDRVADRDAACIARLRAGGAVLIGLTNMDEGALGAAADNP
jgi:aspartyl-tRNA(Asn)/glutamyl-tRNA(Gln) amidotransferase subunit A